MLGPKIKSRMSEVGIKTQTELAEKAGLSVQYVNDLLLNRRGKRMGFQAVSGLARALKVKPIFFSIDTATAESVQRETAAADLGVVPACRI